MVTKIRRLMGERRCRCSRALALLAKSAGVGVRCAVSIKHTCVALISGLSCGAWIRAAPDSKCCGGKMSRGKDESFLLRPVGAAGNAAMRTVIEGLSYVGESEVEGPRVGLKK